MQNMNFIENMDLWVKYIKNGVNNFSIFCSIFDCKFIRILDCVTLTGKFVKTRQSLITFEKKRRF